MTMGRYKRILVAFDGSESSRNALLQTFRLANDEGCWITVTSVVPPYEGELELVGIKDIIAAIRKPYENALSLAEKMAKDDRASIKTVCEEGEVYERIVDLADAENNDVIVMGRRGMRPFARALLGSVTARVIGHSQRDVLVVPEGTKIGWKSILLATDGSRYSDLAADRAIDFAKSYGGKLMVVSVVDLPSEFYAEAPQVVEDLIVKARGFVLDAKKKAEASGVSVEISIEEGEAYKIITEIAREQKADVIIMGSHGRTGLKRLLMGSVTEEVIGHATCPVLIAKSIKR